MFLYFDLKFFFLLMLYLIDSWSNVIGVML